MPRYSKHIFICTNQRSSDHPRGSCDPNGCGELHRAFKTKLAKCGVNTEVRANKAGCLDQCEHGPSVVVYPEGIWYGGVTVKDVDEIVESHILGNKPVERLVISEKCLNGESCEHKRKT